MIKQDLLHELLNHLRKQQFVELATCNRDAKPHVSAELSFKICESTLYLLQHMDDPTCANLRENPFVSVATFNIVEVVGYFIYGTVEILEKGEEYEACLREWESKQTKMATDVVVENVRGEKGLKSIRFTYLSPRAFYKISIESIEKVE